MSNIRPIAHDYEMYSVHDVDMYRQQIESLLQHFDAREKERYFLIKFNQRESLFKITRSANDDLTLSHYDLMGLPMLPDMQSKIQTAFPHVKVEDICRNERASATYTTAAYGANQDIRHAANREEALEIAFQKLAHPTLVSKPSAAGLFGRATASNQSVQNTNEPEKKKKPTW